MMCVFGVLFVVILIGVGVVCLFGDVVVVFVVVLGIIYDVVWIWLLLSVV